MQNEPKTCPKCNYPAPLSTAYCAKCGHQFGTQIEAGQAQAYAPTSPTNSFEQYPTIAYERKSKIAAGLFAILFPYLGIQGFYTGNTALGLTVLLSSIACFGLGVITFGIGFIITGPALGIIHLLSIIQGIVYLTSSDAYFHQKYVVEKRWF